MWNLCTETEFLLEKENPAFNEWNFKTFGYNSYYKPCSIMPLKTQWSSDLMKYLGRVCYSPMSVKLQIIFAAVCQSA